MKKLLLAALLMVSGSAFGGSSSFTGKINTIIFHEASAIPNQIGTIYMEGFSSPTNNCAKSSSYNSVAIYIKNTEMGKMQVAAALAALRSGSEISVSVDDADSFEFSGGKYCYLEHLRTR